MRDSKENYVPVVNAKLRESGTVFPPVYSGSRVSVLLQYPGQVKPRNCTNRPEHRQRQVEQAREVNPTLLARGHGWDGWKFLELPIQKSCFLVCHNACHDGYSGRLTCHEDVMKVAMPYPALFLYAPLPYPACSTMSDIYGTHWNSWNFSNAWGYFSFAATEEREGECLSST